MSTKSQLHACSEILLTGIRAAERAGPSESRVLATLRACLDVVEHLEYASHDVNAAHVATALAIVEQAAVELGSERGAAQTVVVLVRQVIDRLHRLKTALPA
jgi:hypothetical protein